MRMLVGGVAIACAMALGVGCSGVIGSGGGGGPDGGAASLAFTSPTSGASFMRGHHSALTGAMVAQVPIAIDEHGDLARVAIVAGKSSLGDVDATGALASEVDATGTVTLTATGYDATGAVIATATVDITIADLPDTDCHGWLDRYEVPYMVGPKSDGVVDPITVMGPVNGVPYRYLGNTSPRAMFFMDCRLALSLAKAAPILRARDVVEVEDIGVYNYRCINNDGTPPNCNVGMSEHAYAMAIDFGAFKTKDGGLYTVQTDFVIDPKTEPTCTAATEPGKDAWLHETICALKHDKIWNIVLTPNYNDLHRDHFHVDLTPGSDYIRFTGANAGNGDE